MTTPTRSARVGVAAQRFVPHDRFGTPPRRRRPKKTPGFEHERRLFGWLPPEGHVEQRIPHTSGTDRRPYWERLDPFYEPEHFERPLRWKQPGRSGLVERLTARGQLLTRNEWIPEFVPVPERDTPSSRLYGSAGFFRVVSALYGWHHLHVKQLAAITGHSPTNIHQLVRPLFQHGVIERGNADPFRYGNSLHRIGYFYRLRSNSAEFDAWWNQLTGDEKTAITLDQPRPSRSRHVRHDLIAAELALRAREVNPRVAAVLGEGVSDPTWITPMPVPKVATPPGGGWRADATIVRDDGLRVAVEIIQKTYVADFVRKLHHWARFLGRTGAPTEHGVTVLFLFADSEGHGLARKLLEAMRTALSLAELEQLGLTPDQAFAVRRSLFVGTWKDDFPAIDYVTPAFVNLEAWMNASQLTEPDHDWRPVNLLGSAADRASFPSPTGPHRLDLLDRTDTYLGVPPWNATTTDRAS